MTRGAQCLLVLLTLALGACTPALVIEPIVSPANAPPAFPFDVYRSLPADEVLRIDASASVATVLVTRDGPLARFGHDHVVASRDIQGLVWLPGGAVMTGARVDLYVSLSTLIVDDPLLREAAGLDTTPSEADIAGTRQNMNKSLEVEQFPWLIVAGELRADGNLDAQVTLHGVTVPVTIPLATGYTEGQLTVTGSLTIRQTDHGITPFSAMGGALSVGDELRLEFELQAN